MAHGAILSFTSKVLKNNPLGDPAERSIPVFLPPSYDGKKRFPVIYMLAGFTGTGLSYLNYGFGGVTLPQRLNHLIASKKMQECIVVMPDCMTRYGGSQYVDSTGTGRYATHLVEELIPHIDKTFATFASVQCRAVMGKSSGGFGALSLAMRFPGVFGAAACHSGDVAFDLTYASGFAKVARALAKYGSVKKFMAIYDRAQKKPKDGFPIIEMMAMSACYSPQPKRRPPENFDLPFDLHTAETNKAVFAKWLAHDPLVMVQDPKYRKALKALHTLFIDVGVQDEYFLDYGARRLVAELTKHKVPHRYEEFVDSHMDISYRYDVSMPLMAAAISRD